MITIADVKKAIVKLLNANGYTVVASEVQEGFNKPACFVDVMPVNVSVETQNYEKVTNSVEITYFPAVETKEEMIKAAEHFRQLFLYSSIAVNDRFLSVNEITFDAEKSALITYFELEYLTETQMSREETVKMKHLEERIVKLNYGTSENSD